MGNRQSIWQAVGCRGKMAQKKIPGAPSKYLFLAADGNSPHSGLLYRLARLGWAFSLQNSHRFPFHPISHKQFEVDASLPHPRHFPYPGAERKARQGKLNSTPVIFPLPPAPLITSGTTQCACLVWPYPVDSTLVSKKLFQSQSYFYWRPPRRLKRRGSSQELFF